MYIHVATQQGFSNAQKFSNQIGYTHKILVAKFFFVVAIII